MSCDESSHLGMFLKVSKKSSAVSHVRFWCLFHTPCPLPPLRFVPAHCRNLLISFLGDDSLREMLVRDMSISQTVVLSLVQIVTEHATTTAL